MDLELSLSIAGEVRAPRAFSRDSLAALPGQVPDVSTRLPGREGRGVELAALLAAVGVLPAATHVTVSADGGAFHASVPLDVVRDRAVIIFELDGQPLPESAGGPFRFLIADYAACHTAEIDDCANVKFVDRIELTAERGFDNRPQDDVEHAKLHGK